MSYFVPKEELEEDGGVTVDLLLLQTVVVNEGEVETTFN